MLVASGVGLILLQSWGRWLSIVWALQSLGSNLLATVFKMVGEEYFDRSFVDEARAVRLNNSSTQVYMALKDDERIDEHIDLSKCTHVVDADSS